MKKRKAFIYPFTSVNNRYVSLQKQAIKDCGFSVLPLKSMLPEVFKLSSVGGVIIVNWLESQAVKADGGISFKYFILFFFKLMLMYLTRIKIIWIRHNYQSHQAKGVALCVSNIFLKIMERSADVIVCHSKDRLEFGDVYIPHPLYFEGGVDANCSEMVPSYIFIGAVMPYKGLEELLEIWPKGVKFSIFGSLSDEKFGAKLRAIAKQRALLVDFKFEFITDIELKSLVMSNNVMVIPNVRNSSYVSGNYFLAKSYGMRILAREGAIDLTISRTGSFIFSDQKTLLNSIDQISHSKEMRKDIQSEAKLEYGEAVLAKAWSELLKSTP